MTASRYVLVSLALLLGISACDTADSARADLNLLTPEVIDWRTLSQDPADLVGTWELVASIYGETIDGREVVVTPESSGRTETWTFRADGTATQSRNGEVVFESDYRVARRAYFNWTEDDYASILFGDDGYGEDFGVARDVLILDRTPFDGPQSRYRRR